METRPLVSILMPAYNADQYIGQAIESVLSQSWTTWELLICDDGSTDQTIDIVRSYNDPRLIVYVSKTNEGYLSASNLLFSKAKGDFVTFQDADDYSSEHRLEKLIQGFKSYPDVGMIGSYAQIVSKSGALIATDKRTLGYESILRKLPEGSQFNGATVMVKREVLQAIGGYRTYFDKFAYQDYDWTYRIAERYRSINIPEVLYYYRQHSGSNSKKIDPRRMVSGQLVHWLAQDRFMNGSDYLDRGEIHLVDAYVEQLLRPYKLDSSLVYRNYASNFMYNKLFRDAIKTSWMAIKSNPFQFVNYRTFLYCLRKSLLA